MILPAFLLFLLVMFEEEPPVALAARVGDRILLCLPVPTDEHTWTLEFDRDLLGRERLAQRWGTVVVYELHARREGRTLLRGWCARGMERPSGRCRIEIRVDVRPGGG